MHSEGRIADGENVEFSQWEPARVLDTLSHNTARFSRGFLCGELGAWFNSFGEHWLPFFHILGIDVSITGVRREFELPSELARMTTAEVDGERAILGLDQNSAKIFAQAVAPSVNGVAGEVVLEYIERRLLASLAKSWSGSDNFGCLFVSTGWDGEGDIAATLGVDLEIGGTPCTLWFGFGPRLLEKLDLYWRTVLLRRDMESSQTGLSDHIYSVTVDLTELSVPPAMLIDYMRSGTIIDLEVALSNQVRLSVDNEPWAEGELCQFNGRMAVRVTSTNVAERVIVESTTRVRVEIARTELDREGLVEHSQNGAVLLTRSSVEPHASLIISGEDVATAVIGEINGSFALNILPK